MTNKIYKYAFILVSATLNLVLLHLFITLLHRFRCCVERSDLYIKFNFGALIFDISELISAFYVLAHLFIILFHRLRCCIECSDVYIESSFGALIIAIFALILVLH